MTFQLKIVQNSVDLVWILTILVDFICYTHVNIQLNRCKVTYHIKEIMGWIQWIAIEEKTKGFSRDGRALPEIE